MQFPNLLKGLSLQREAQGWLTLEIPIKKRVTQLKDIAPDERSHFRNSLTYYESRLFWTFAPNSSDGA